MHHANPNSKPLRAGRRGFFLRLLAGLGILSSAPLLARQPQGGDQPSLHWINASRAQVNQQPESDWFEHGVRRIRGHSYSRANIHLDLPLPVGAQIQAVWLRLVTQSGATVQHIRLFDCEREVAEVGPLTLSGDNWRDHRLLLPQVYTVARSLSLCIECRFAGTAREIGLAAIACEMSRQTV